MEKPLKNTIFKTIFWVVFIGLFSIGIRHFFPKREVVVKTETITEYKTITKTKYVDKPVPYFLEIPLPGDTIVIPADTALLIQRYKTLWEKFYTRKYYTDTLDLDTLGNVVFSNQVFANSMGSVEWDSNIEVPFTYRKETITPLNEFYIGLEAGNNNLSPNIDYIRKGKYKYSIRYNALEGTVHGGVSINLNNLQLW